MENSDQLPYVYHGKVTLPSEKESINFSLNINRDAKSVELNFSEPIEKSSNWKCTDIKIIRRTKFDEIVFFTHGIPKPSVPLIWKINASLTDKTAAGVVIARENDKGVKGEKGFKLISK